MIEVRPYLDPSWVVAVRDAQSPPHDNDAVVGRLAQDTPPRSMGCLNRRPLRSLQNCWWASSHVAP